MAKFAGYGFNKSHSAAYALIAYQTAWLKAHYPAQFMAALLSCDVGNTDKVVRYIIECRDHDIEVLPPDINESDKDFAVVNDRIRFGLAAVKNVGGQALDSIMEVRAADGPYGGLEDFCDRVDSRKVNRRVIESLIKAGAFDSLGAKRSQLFAILDIALEQAQSAQRDRLSGQISLFSAMPQAQGSKANTIDLPNISEWTEKERLLFEKETVGFYLTGHPLDNFYQEIKAVADTDLTSLGDWGDNQPVRVGGLVREYKDHRSKKGDRMAFIVLEDRAGAVEVVVFPDAFAKCGHLLTSDEPIIVLGTVKQEEQGAKIIAESVDNLSEARSKYTNGARILLKSDQVSRPKLESLKNKVREFHGTCPVSLTLQFTGRGEVDIEPPSDFTVRPCKEFDAAVEGLLGYAAVMYLKTKAEIQPRNGGKSGRWRQNGQG